MGLLPTGRDDGHRNIRPLYSSIFQPYPLHGLGEGVREDKAVLGTLPDVPVDADETGFPLGGGEVGTARLGPGGSACGGIDGEEPAQSVPPREITKQDLMDLGLSGSPDAGERRKKLLKACRFPEHMSANAMLQALNLLYTLEEVQDLVSGL